MLPAKSFAAVLHLRASKFLCSSKASSTSRSFLMRFTSESLLMVMAMAGMATPTLALTVFTAAKAAACVVVFASVNASA